MDRGAWRATVHRVTKSQTQLRRQHTRTQYCSIQCLYQPAFPPTVHCGKKAPFPPHTGQHLLLVGYSMMAFLTSVTWHALYFELHFSNEWGASQVVLVVKNPPANAGNLRDLGLIPGLGRSPGEGHGNPLQRSCLESPMDRGAWQTTVHGVAKSQTWLKQVEHLFICLLAIYISSLKKCLFRSLILNFFKRNLAFQLELIKI